MPAEYNDRDHEQQKFLYKIKWHIMAQKVSSIIDTVITLSLEWIIFKIHQFKKKS